MSDKDRLIEELNDLVKTQNETIASLNATIKELQETVKELQRQLKQNSQNSSKPPSSDGFNKPSPKSLRTKSGRKPGGQKGHTGSHMELPHDPDEIKQHLPEKCLTCPHLTKCLKDKYIFKCREKRYTVDAVTTTYVTEHQSIEAVHCPCGRSPEPASFPEDVKAYIQYGDSVSVLVAMLSTFGAVSAMRIHNIIGSLLGVSLSTGTVMSMVSKCAKKIGPIMKEIQRRIERSHVGNFDETGARVNGQLHWVHNSSTDLYTYQTINKKRGKEGIDANGVLPRFHGVAMHDCWSPYWKYDHVGHAVCNAHLLRELTGIEENEPKHKWAIEFKTLLRTMKKAKEKAIESGKSELSYYYLHKFSHEYDRIMELADKERPSPADLPGKKRGRKKRGKERALIERLMQLKDAVCLFIHDFKVPFDNNQAERDVRNVKTKVKVSGGFRTEPGAQKYLDIMSFISTGRKHSVNIFEALNAAFAGKAEIVLQ